MISPWLELLCNFDLCTECAPLWRDLLLKPCDEEDDNIAELLHWDDSSDSDSSEEEQFDPRIPITTLLCEVGWKFNEFKQAVAANRVFFNPPAGSGAGALTVQEQKKAKKKAKRKTKKEKKHRLQALEAASDAGEGASNCLHTRSLSLEDPATK